MEVTKTDIVRCETAMAALKKGKFDLGGEEVLALAQVFKWMGELHGRLKAALSPPPLIPEPTPADFETEASKCRKGKPRR